MSSRNECYSWWNVKGTKLYNKIQWLGQVVQISFRLLLIFDQIDKITVDAQKIAKYVAEKAFLIVLVVN